MTCEIGRVLYFLFFRVFISRFHFPGQAVQFSSGSAENSSIERDSIIALLSSIPLPYCELKAECTWVLHS